MCMGDVPIQKLQTKSNYSLRHSNFETSASHTFSRHTTVYGIVVLKLSYLILSLVIL